MSQTLFTKTVMNLKEVLEIMSALEVLGLDYVVTRKGFNNKNKNPMFGNNMRSWEITEVRPEIIKVQEGENANE